MRFHPFPNIPKFVTVKPRLPTEVYLSYSSATESIFLNFLSWLSNVEHDINIKKSVRMLFQQNCLSNLNYITICDFEKVHSDSEQTRVDLARNFKKEVPEEKDPNELTMEEALILIEKRKEYDKSKKKKK